MTKNNIILALVAAAVLAVGAYAYYQSGVEAPVTNTTGNSQNQGNTVTTTSGNSNDDISADFNATSVQSSDSSFQSVDGDINKL